MLTKIEDLILSSEVIPDEKRNEYLGIAKFLSKKHLKKFILILERENEAKDIVASTEHQKNEVNKTFIEKLESLFKTEEKSAKKADRKDDQDKGEQLLVKLKNL